MEDRDKTKEELLEELGRLRARILEFEERDTARKRTEDELRSSEEWFRILFEQSKDAIFVADALSRQLVDCNLQAERLIGKSRQEILKMRADELHPA
ncbi:MAG TPA: PAS domain-containing protein, partial [Candidatus Omnitrophota bacterium]|nr:PAS domain-containing protein [Candidatus Omnitrophota bacterium]